LLEHDDQPFRAVDFSKQRERILVMGIGGGGGNALNHIIRSGVEGVEFVAANTDARSLDANEASVKVVLGEKLTKGLGAGSDPNVGADAAKESLERIKAQVAGIDMIFLTAGMGGGTGTGASPIIAEAAKELGALVVAVVTTPFSFEMKTRFRIAQQGIENLRGKVDALLVVENDRLLALADEKTKIMDAYRLADEVLRQAVQGVTDLILKPGMIGVDFADIKTVMRNAGSAIMGIGHGEGENRAETAAKAAIKSPLMSVSMKGAKGILFNVSGGSDLTIFEMQKAANIIKDTADEDAIVIWGHAINEDLNGSMRITVIATGFAEKIVAPAAEPSPVSHPAAPAETSRSLLRGRVHLRPQPPSSQSQLSIEEADLQPSTPEDDIFTVPGVPRTQYDIPAVLRRNQLKGRR